MTSIDDLICQLTEQGASIDLSLKDCRLNVRGVQRLNPSLLAKVYEHKEQVRGYLLLCELWEAGYSLELHPSARGGWFILPVGAARASEKLIKQYEIHHDAALRLMLEVLPKDAEGQPDCTWWNSTARTFSVDTEATTAGRAAGTQNR